jgi:hypothetical protein
LENAVPFVDSIPHDWWIALNASIIGNIKNIKIPLVLYRQHSNNTIGAKKRVKISIRDIQPEKRKLRILKAINYPYIIANALKLRHSGSDKMMIISKIDKDYEIYRNSIMKKNPIHFSAFLIAWKYRKIWYNNYPMIYALAKLIV